MCTQMDITCHVKVGVLLEDDSWDMFQKFAGNIVNSSDLHNVAKIICRECGGLPLALVTLGRALRHKEASTWFKAANELRASKPVNIEGMQDKVYLCIKLSFDYLRRSEEAIHILFFCCLFPEDYPVCIEILVFYGIAEGFLCDIQTIKEGITRVKAIIENFIASCLLLNYADGYVKIHDVIRDVTKHIASDPKHGVVVMSGLGLKSWPRSGYPKHVKEFH